MMNMTEEEKKKKLDEFIGNIDSEFIGEIAKLYVYQLDAYTCNTADEFRQYVDKLIKNTQTNKNKPIERILDNIRSTIKKMSFPEIKRYFLHLQSLINMLSLTILKSQMS